MKLTWMRFTAALASASTVNALKVAIIADQNRDGKVDCKDSSIRDRCSSEATEALFLPAITDTDKRCSKKITPKTDEKEFEKCHDGSDNVLRHPERLATVIIKPVKNLGKGSTGRISINCDQTKYKGCYKKVRIFQYKKGEWTYIDPKTQKFTADELKEGLELGVDGRDVRRPGVWDGRAQLELSVQDGKNGKKATDCVAMRVAPILTHHHAQKAEKVFTFTDQLGYEPYAQTAKEIVDAVKGNSEASVYGFEHYEELWTQDYFEPTYASIPKHDKQVKIRVMLRNTLSAIPAGRAVFEELRDDDVGAVQYLKEPEGTLNPDGLGNLETIPPYEKGSAKYPVGRAVMGITRGEKPTMLEFLHAQEEQDPIELDTNWLEIGHVDEFLQFLPADSPRGWVLMAADPAAGIGLLKKAEANGHGSELATSRTPQSYDPPDEFSACIPNTTIAEVLEIENMITANEYADESIRRNIEILKNETGLTDKEVFRIPAIYWTDVWECPQPEFPDDDDEDDMEEEEEEEDDDDESEDKSGQASKTTKTRREVRRQKLAKRKDSPELDFPDRPDGLEYGLSTFYPASINGLVLEDTVVTGNPWGPIIGGVDVFADAIRKSYAQVGMNVTFVDDWHSMRVGQGGIHCATNSWREVGSEKWW